MSPPTTAVLQLLFQVVLVLQQGLIVPIQITVDPIQPGDFTA
jgi:hypothetical protein